MKITSPLWVAALVLGVTASPATYADQQPLPFACPKDIADLSPYRAYGFSGPAQASQLAMRASGIVNEVLVDQGDHVERGTPLLRLLASGEEDAITVAEKRLTMLEERYQSSSRLEEKQHIAALDLLQVEVDMHQAKKDLADARRAARDRTLVAPFSGVIEKTDIEIGEYISAGQSPLRLVDVHHQKVVADVYAGGNFSSCLNPDECVAMVEIEGQVQGPYSIDFVTPVTDTRKGMFQAGFYMSHENASGLPVNVYFLPKENCSLND